MSSDQFEHRLREKFKEASIPPSDHLWANIEKEVQGKSSKKGFVWWFSYGEGLMLLALLLIYFFLPSTFQPSDLPAETQPTETLTLSEPSKEASSSAESNSISIESDQETAKLSESTTNKETPHTQTNQKSTSEVKSYFLAPIQHTVDLKTTFSPTLVPENSLVLSNSWIPIETLSFSYPTLAASTPQLTEWEDLIPLAKQSRWAWEVNYAYLSGTEGLFPIGFSSDDALATDNLEDGMIDSPDPSSAQAPPSDRERTFRVTHGQGTHLIGLGGSYLLTRALFVESGVNLKISEIGEIVENVGFQEMANELVLGSPVSRAVRPEASTFRQYAISVPLGVGIQLGKGKTKVRLSSGIQFEYLRNNAAIELSNLRQEPGVNLFAPPTENEQEISEFSEWQYQTQLYFSGRILHRINRSMHLQLGAQFQFLQLPEGGSEIANWQDSQGGLQLGIIWAPMKRKIFKSAHP